MLIPSENQKNNKITDFLLSVFLCCCFSFIHSQVYISEGVEVFVEKNTVITENLENAVSKSTNACLTHSEKTFTQQRRVNQKIFDTSVKQINKKTFVLSQKRKRKKLKKQKSDTVYYGLLLKNNNDYHFTTSSSSKKTILIPEDHHLKWKKIPETVKAFSVAYSVIPKKSFYISIYTLFRSNQCLRTRPPPFLSFS